MSKAPKRADRKPLYCDVISYDSAGSHVSVDYIEGRLVRLSVRSDSGDSAEFDLDMVEFRFLTDWMNNLLDLVDEHDGSWSEVNKVHMDSGLETTKFGD